MITTLDEFKEAFNEICFHYEDEPSIRIREIRKLRANTSQDVLDEFSQMLEEENEIRAESEVNPGDWYPDDGTSYGEDD